ncbi:MAG: TPM domain-containing protein [Oscillospiraceae bacterium]
MKKMILTLFTAVCAMVLMAVPVYAKENIVLDDSGVFEGDSVQFFTDDLGKLTGWNVCVASVDKTPETGLLDRANELYNENFEANSDGALVLVDTAADKLEISINGDCGRFVQDCDKQVIIGNVQQHFAEKDYAGVAMSAVTQLSNYYYDVVADENSEAGTKDVYDRAGIFGNPQAISEEIASLKAKTGWEIAVLTTDDAQGKTSMEYADDFYDRMFGINTDGVVYLIDMDNRKSYISTSGAGIDYLSDNRIYSITDATVSYLKAKDYDGAALFAVSEISKYYDDGYPDNGDTYVSASFGNSIKYQISQNWLVCVVCALVLAGTSIAIVVFRYKKIGQSEARAYVDEGNTEFTEKSDNYLREYTTQRRIESSSSSGGGSSTHSSSSGGSHGGGGSSF